MENLTEIAIACTGVLAMLILNDMRDSLKEASRSVEKLNTNVAVILERVESHDEELKDHKTQLQELNNHVQDIKQRI